MARQFVYHMQGLTKTYPGNRKVLENINLSFYPDAKIGVLGVNGSGKSTLLRIMAGLDTEFTGEAWAAEGARVGYLPQEPELDADQDRARERDGRRRRKARAARALQRDRRQLLGRDRRRDGEAAGRDRRQNLWDLDSQVDQAMDALRCPPDDAEVETLSGGERRRVALCKLLLEAARAAAARRADQPSRRRDGGLARRASAQLSGRDPDRHPRPLLPRQRHRLDPRARPRPRHSLSRATTRPGSAQKQKRLAQEGREEEARQRTLARRAGVDRGIARARARPNPRRATSATRIC